MAVIEIDRLRKEYGTLVAVHDTHLAVEAGQVLGLIGPNGAGKTTLLRMLATVLKPTRGTIRVLGLDIGKDYLAVRKKIGYLPDFFNLYNDLTIEECLVFFAKAYGVNDREIAARLETVLEQIDMKGKRKDFVRHLSRGMVQRLGLGALLVHDPDVYLLDEPASGLDPRARIGLRDILLGLSRAGKTVIISSHILTELSGFCSHIAIMHEGKIVVGGAVEDMERRLAGTQRVTLRVLADVSRAAHLAEAYLKGAAVRVEDSQVVVEMVADDAVLAGLNRHLVEQGVGVISLSPQKTSLEDIFMKVSGGMPGEGVA